MSKQISTQELLEKVRIEINKTLSNYIIFNIDEEDSNSSEESNEDESYSSEDSNEDEPEEISEEAELLKIIEDLLLNFRNK